MLDFGFTTFSEFQVVINAQARETCERATARGLLLHKQRTLFHCGADRENLLVTEDNCLRAAIEYDLGLIAQGYIPVLVEQPIFSSAHGLAGTPDVIF